MRYLYLLAALTLLPAAAFADDTVAPAAPPNSAGTVAVTNSVVSTNAVAATNSVANSSTNSTSPPPKPPPFKASIMEDRIQGVNLNVRYGILVSGTNRLTFVIPDKMGMQSDSAKQKVEIQATDGSYISVRMLSGDDAKLLELKPDELRDQVAGRYSRGKISGESAISIEGLSGPAFDVQWVAGGRSEMFTRIAFIPLGKELIEFNLTAAKDAAPPYLSVLGEMTLSFRVGPVDGPLKVRKFLTDF